MKPSSIRMASFSTVFVLFAAISVPLWANDRPLMKTGPVLTDNESKAQIVTAKTPKVRRTLALYSNEEASQFEVEAREHEGMIEAYRMALGARASTTPGGVATIEHCELLAKSDREMARALRQMAAAHEAMARKASKK